MKIPYDTEFEIMSESSNHSALTDSFDLLVEGLGVPITTTDEPTEQTSPDASSYTCGRLFSIHKTSKEETLGIELGKVHKYGGVFVTKIEPSSKFACTGLVPGMQILSINDRPCPVAFQMVAMMMKETVGDLKISAIDTANKNNLAMAIEKERQIKSGFSFTRSLRSANGSNKKSKNIKESREPEILSPVVGDVRSSPPTPASKNKPFGGGARFMANRILHHKRNRKLRGRKQEKDGDTSKESSSHASAASTDALFQIPQQSDEQFSDLNTMPTMLAEEYYESKGMGFF